MRPKLFKGHPSRKVQIFAEQGECFAEVHVGDKWLFFAKTSPKTKGLELSYYSSNPSGPVEERREYVERLRRLASRDGLSFVAGKVEFPDDDFSKGYLSKGAPDYRLLITSKDENEAILHKLTIKEDSRLALLRRGSTALMRTRIRDFATPRKVS